MTKESELKIETSRLVGFLIRSKKEGYALGSKNIIREKDGSYSTRFKEGDFDFHDNWFGGEPFGGREVVKFKEKPYWMMVYYGADLTGKELVIPTLIKALSNMPIDFPARGPQVFEEGQFRYENEWEGGIEQFSGEEQILSNGERMYSAKYMGGLVDQRK
ncbi:MAG: DUF5680 domain-containing protein [Patescibacteria group bacterium]|nr:DUF5680 domain-containing protein [Patescibacteria group bacterium]